VAGVIQGRAYGGEEPGGIILGNIMRDHVDDADLSQNGDTASGIARVDGQNEHEQFYRRYRDVAHPVFSLKSAEPIQSTPLKPESQYSRVRKSLKLDELGREIKNAPRSGAKNERKASISKNTTVAAHSSRA
jgi:hypothetical protein